MVVGLWRNHPRNNMLEKQNFNLKLVWQSIIKGIQAWWVKNVSNFISSFATVNVYSYVHYDKLYLFTIETAVVSQSVIHSELQHIWILTAVSYLGAPPVQISNFWSNINYNLVEELNRKLWNLNPMAENLRNITTRWNWCLTPVIHHLGGAGGG